jgi:hypothetical protein
VRLQVYPIALARSGLYLAAGPHVTAGRDRASLDVLVDKPAASLGAIAALGWQFRGEGGFLISAELSSVYEPSAANISEAAQRTFYPGGAITLGYAR